MAWENTAGEMDANTKGNTNLTKSMATELTLGLMAANMWGNGLTASATAKDGSFQSKGSREKVCGNRISGFVG